MEKEKRIHFLSSLFFVEYFLPLSFKYISLLYEKVTYIRNSIDFSCSFCYW